jgi:hypothetical protein
MIGIGDYYPLKIEPVYSQLHHHVPPSDKSFDTLVDLLLATYISDLPGISWPVPFVWTKVWMTSSTSHFSRLTLIFSHASSSETQTVDMMFAYVQRFDLRKSILSSSRSWYLSQAFFHSEFQRCVVSARTLTAAL